MTTRGDPGCKGILPLRTFIQETLRRSRTSYSTLQVALYYLVVIKPHIRREHPDQPASRALQCGRRMFLSALILASKYLQDRNYSARAWSKISGLNTLEINHNELLFLDVIDWKLHVSETTYQRWTEIVLKYTPTPEGVYLNADGLTWREVIPMLTSDLEMVNTGAPSRFCQQQSTPFDGDNHNNNNNALIPPAAGVGGQKPFFFCSALNNHSNQMQITPCQRPFERTIPYRTASFGCNRRSSPLASHTTSHPIRQSSLARSVSSTSSPGSTVSDSSSRSFGSSSTTSVFSAPSACAPRLPSLAACATRRCAMMQGDGGSRENETGSTLVSPMIRHGLHEKEQSLAHDSVPLPTVAPPPQLHPSFSGLSFCSNNRHVYYAPQARTIAMGETEAVRGLCELSSSRESSLAPSPRLGRKRGRPVSEEFTLQPGAGAGDLVTSKSMMNLRHVNSAQIQPQPLPWMDSQQQSVSTPMLLLPPVLPSLDMDSFILRPRAKALKPSVCPASGLHKTVPSHVSHVSS